MNKSDYNSLNDKEVIKYSFNQLPTNPKRNDVAIITDINTLTPLPMNTRIKSGGGSFYMSVYFNGYDWLTL